MKKFENVVQFKGENLIAFQTTYSDGNTALVLEDQNKDPFLTASINIPELEIDTQFVAIKDYSENEGILDALQKAGIISPVIETIKFPDSHVPFFIVEIIGKFDNRVIH